MSTPLAPSSRVFTGDAPVDRSTSGFPLPRVSGPGSTEEVTLVRGLCLLSGACGFPWCLSPTLQSQTPKDSYS